MGRRNDFKSGDQPVELSSDKGAVQATPQGGNVTDATFVDDCIVEVAVAEVRIYRDITPLTVSRSGWPIRALLCLDL